MNQEQHNLLCRGVPEWNAWRQQNPEVKIELSCASLYRADLQGADLQGADLRGANLRGANLFGANLLEANLQEADLYAASLCAANLLGASLRWANLYAANLLEADLQEADFRGAKHIWQAGPGGSRGDMLYAVMWDDGIHFFTGCFGGTEAKFLAAVEKQHGNNTHGQYYRAMMASAKVWAGVYEVEGQAAEHHC